MYGPTAPASVAYGSEEVRESNPIVNFMFRGNMPLTRGGLCAPEQKLDFEGLSRAMHGQVEAPFELHANFSVLDIRCAVFAFYLALQYPQVRAIFHPINVSCRPLIPLSPAWSPPRRCAPTGTI